METFLSESKWSQTHPLCVIAFVVDFKIITLVASGIILNKASVLAFETPKHRIFFLDKNA